MSAPLLGLVTTAKKLACSEGMSQGTSLLVPIGGYFVNPSRL